MLKTVVLSVLFIYIVHNIIYFLKDNLTIPKTKDLVSITEKKYDEIYNVMKYSSFKNKSTVPSAIMQSTTNIEELPNPTNMKEELRNFLKSHSLRN